MSQFESNFRNPFKVMNRFESILVKTLWVMSLVKSKLSETKLNQKNFESYPCLVVCYVSVTNHEIFFQLIGIL